MNSGNSIIDLLQSALDVWSGKLSEIWDLISTSPENFHGGTVFQIITGIHDSLKAIAYALLVLFFVMGVIKTTTDFRDLKRPEQAFKLFLRFTVAKVIVDSSMELMLAVYRIVQGIIDRVSAGSSGITAAALVLPDVLKNKISACSFLESIPLWLVSVLLVAVVFVLSVLMVLTVYSRFFSLFMYSAIAPVPLASYASEGSSQIGRHFLKSYASVCLQGAIVILSCVIYSAIAVSPPSVSDSGTAVTMVWTYMGELVFNLLILVSAVRLSDRVVKEMIGV